MESSGFGFRAGLNNSFIRIKNNNRGYPSDDKIGFHLGLIYNQRLSDVFSIQPELSYTQTGYTYLRNSALGEVTSNVRLDYLQIPVLLKAGTGNNVYRVFFNVGPYINIALRGVERETISNNTTKSVLSISTERGLNPFDIGIAAGAGAAYKLMNGQIFAEIRYNYGLTDIIKNYKFTTASNNRSWNFSLGYLIYI